MGLSKADQRRLDRERARVQEKLAAERIKLEKRRAAEQQEAADRAAYEEAKAAHAARFGPLTVTGPDGVEVTMGVTPTGRASFSDPPQPPRSLRSGCGVDSPDVHDAETGLIILAIVAAVAVATALLAAVGALFSQLRPGLFVLGAKAPDVKIVVRRRDEDEAADLLRQARAAVADSGVTGLRTWAATAKERRPAGGL